MSAEQIFPVSGLHQKGYTDFRPVEFVEEVLPEANPLGVPESVTGSPPDETQLEVKTQMELEQEQVALMENEKVSRLQTSETPASVVKVSTPQTPKPPSLDS